MWYIFRRRYALVTTLLYSNLAPGSALRIRPELIPHSRLYELEQGIHWVLDYRELHCGLDTAKINRVLQKRELLTVFEPVLSPHTEGQYLLHPSRGSSSGTFVAQPTLPILSWRHQIDYYTPESR